MKKVRYGIIQRLLLLARRAIKAQKFGFFFYGTTHTPFPRQLKLRGVRIPLSSPNDNGYQLDVLNVMLDDEYGIEKIPENITTIVDVGANIGIFSLWAWAHFPNARVHAYEPNPKIIPYAKSNLLHAEVEFFCEGVGSRSYVATLVESKQSRMVQTLASATGNIPITSLATVVERIGGRVDLLKIDCEGAEWDIFLDLESLKRVGRIRMEYHLVGSRQVKDFEAAVERIQFVCEKIEEQGNHGIAWLVNKNQCVK